MAEDLDELESVGEVQVMNNLRKRFQDGKPYTRAASCILAVNPCKPLPELYSVERMETYSSKFAQDENGESLPPHIFAVSGEARKSLVMEKRPQSIVVSGESGSGKTESARLVMQHLAYMTQESDAQENRALVERILGSSNVLEAFGNAVTGRNPNSSRFGKFIRLYLDPSGSRIIGANLSTYLLEQSRVAEHAQGERNFHIFYQVRSGAFSDLAGEQFPANPRMLGASESNLEEDHENAKATRQALHAVGFSDNEIKQMCRLLSVVLWLGEVQPAPKECADQRAGLVPGPALQAVCSLLGAVPESVQHGLCSRTISAGGEQLTCWLSEEQVKANCLALAKSLYGWMFEWIVDRINSTIALSGEQQSITSDDTTIGVLDIFGFESFQVNSLEQLCINVANERLQQLFNDAALNLVQSDYESEGLPWVRVAHSDQCGVIQALQGRIGSAFALLNEECVLPKGTARSFVSKLVASQSGLLNSCIAGDRLNPHAFYVNHYAYRVEYRANQFLSKNKATLFEPGLAMLEHASLLECSLVQALATAHQVKASRGTQQSHLLASRFRLELDELVTSLQATRVHFVRCIKPNASLAHGLFDDDLALPQIRCSGIVAAIQVARAGYEDRVAHTAMLSRYRALHPWAVAHADRETIQGLLERWCAPELHGPNASSAPWFVGHSKSFFRKGTLSRLDKILGERLGSAARSIQRVVRGRRCHRHFNLFRSSLVRLQAATRARRSRARFLNLVRCAVVVQSFARMAKAMVWRGDVQRACVDVQRVARGMIHRKRFSKLAAAAREERERQDLRFQMSRMEQQVVQLRAELLEAEERTVDLNKEKEDLKEEVERLRAENQILWANRNVGQGKSSAKGAQPRKPKAIPAAKPSSSSPNPSLLGQDKSPSCAKGAQFRTSRAMPAAKPSSMYSNPRSALGNLGGVHEGRGNKADKENSSLLGNQLLAHSMVPSTLKPFAEGFVSSLMSSGESMLSRARDFGAFLIEEIEPRPFKETQTLDKVR